MRPKASMVTRVALLDIPVKIFPPLETLARNAIPALDADCASTPIPEPLLLVARPCAPIPVELADAPMTPIAIPAGVKLVNPPVNPATPIPDGDDALPCTPYVV